MSGSLIVSLHDVSPLTQPACDKILDELDQLGIRSASLLLIPNYHGKHPVQDAKAFQHWLRQRVARGHEPVLHGYYHLRPSSGTEGLTQKFTTQVYTAGEGEFFDLDRDEAMKRLWKGKADLAFVGRSIRGFVAPAWLLGKETTKAIADSGFLYTTTINTIQVFPGDKQYRCRSLVWSTRSPSRRAGSLLWNRGLSWIRRA
jgi:uncharacterized protein